MTAPISSRLEAADVECPECGFEETLTYEVFGDWFTWECPACGVENEGESEG